MPELDKAKDEIAGLSLIDYNAVIRGRKKITWLNVFLLERIRYV
jgi:hypothetical protein